MFLWILIVLILWEPIREALIIYRMKRNMNIMARSQIGPEINLSPKDYGLHYARYRGLTAIIKLLKFVFIIFLIYRLLRYPIIGPYDLLSASQRQNESVPDSTTIGGDLSFFVVR